MWKIFIWLLNCKKHDYVKAVKHQGMTYVVKIEKYESTDMLIRKMKEALEADASKASLIRFGNCRDQIAQDMHHGICRQ